MHIFENIDKENLHHAYLIEGNKQEIIPHVLDFIKSIGVEIYNNVDFSHISLDSFKVDDARILKDQSMEKGTSNNKKVFVISINNFLIEAQNTLLKMFEEPIDNTLFFLIIPDIATMLPTLLSRFYLIKTKNNLSEELKQAKEFLDMSINDRIIFIKEMVKKTDENDVSSNVEIDSIRSKAIKFLNALEVILHNKIFSNKLYLKSETTFFDKFFKAREFLSQPGSSIKNIMEGIALIIPTKFNV